MPPPPAPSWLSICCSPARWLQGFPRPERPSAATATAAAARAATATGAASLLPPRPQLEWTIHEGENGQDNVALHHGNCGFSKEHPRAAGGGENFHGGVPLLCTLTTDRPVGRVCCLQEGEPPFGPRETDFRWKAIFLPHSMLKPTGWSVRGPLAAALLFFWDTFILASRGKPQTKGFAFSAPLDFQQARPADVA